MNTSVNELLSNPAFRPLVLLDVLAVFLMIICLVFRRMRKGYYVEQANDARKATMLKEASQRPVEKSEAVEQAVDNAGGFDLDEWRKAHAPESVPDRRPWFFKTVMGRGSAWICRCVPAKTRFPWGRGRSVDRTRTGISTVRCARPAARSPVAVFLWWPLSTGSMESLD